jgi:hypothetical protein
MERERITNHPPTAGVSVSLFGAKTKHVSQFPKFNLCLLLIIYYLSIIYFSV